MQFGPGPPPNCKFGTPDLFAIPEEAATGTSNGALGAYLYKSGKVNNSLAEDMLFEQGTAMGRPSEIRVRLTTAHDKVTEVKVGGTAANIQRWAGEAEPRNEQEILTLNP